MISAKGRHQYAFSLCHTQLFTRTLLQQASLMDAIECFWVQTQKVIKPNPVPTHPKDISQHSASRRLNRGGYWRMLIRRLGLAEV